MPSVAVSAVQPIAFQPPAVFNLSGDLILPAKGPHEILYAQLTLASTQPVSFSHLPSWMTATQSGSKVFLEGKVPPDGWTNYLLVHTAAGIFKVTQPVTMAITLCDPGQGRMSELGFATDARVDVEICASGGDGPPAWTYRPRQSWNRVPDGLTLTIPLAEPKPGLTSLGPRPELSATLEKKPPTSSVDDSPAADENRPSTTDGTLEPIDAFPVSRGGLESGKDQPGLITAIPPGHLTLPTRRHRLSGTVAEAASSSIGTLRIEDRGGQFVEADLGVQIWPHFRAFAGLTRDAESSWTLSGVAQLEKHVPVRIPLPRPGGGDGSRYTWSGAQLPGLSVQSSGSNWYITGQLEPSLVSQPYSLNLRLESPGHRVAARLRMNLLVTGQQLAEFSLLTQNTLLRPLRIPEGLVEEAAQQGAAQGAFIGAATGLFSCGPLCVWPGAVVGAAGGAGGGAGGAQILYDLKIQNTEQDNIERTQLLMNRVFDKRTRRSNDPNDSPYDLVALQEVFDEDRRSMFIAGVGQSFSVRWGPAGSETKINSGLAVLARRANWTVLDHDSRIFDLNCEGADITLLDGDGVAICGDGLANKGFTLTTLAPVGAPAGSEGRFYLVNVHPDANSSDPTIRGNQFMQMIEHLASHTDPRYPILVVGDFNVPGDRDDPDGAAVAGDEYNQLWHLFAWERMYPCDLYRLKYPQAIAANHSHAFFGRADCDSAYLEQSPVDSGNTLEYTERLGPCEKRHDDGYQPTPKNVPNGANAPSGLEIVETGDEGEVAIVGGMHQLAQVAEAVD